ncbi:hypothetical protein [Escherichia phage PJNS034]
MTVYVLMVENQVESEWVFEMDSIYSTHEKATAAGKALPSDFNFYVEPMEVE